MWINTFDRPIPTYGNHGKEFLLNLEYGKYFGHDSNKTSEVVTAIWDSTEDCFFEKETGLAIDDRDIVQWFDEIA
jgi:hypothetical protein